MMLIKSSVCDVSEDVQSPDMSHLVSFMRCLSDAQDCVARMSRMLLLHQRVLAPILSLVCTTLVSLAEDPC